MDKPKTYSHDNQPEGWFCTRDAGHDGPCALTTELDYKLRKILNEVTPETVLSSAAAIAALGFGPKTAFALCKDVVEYKRREAEEAA